MLRESPYEYQKSFNICCRILVQILVLCHRIIFGTSAYLDLRIIHKMLLLGMVKQTTTTRSNKKTPLKLIKQ